MSEPTEQDYLALEAKLMSAVRLAEHYRAELEVRGTMTVAAISMVGALGVVVGVMVGWLAHGLWG